MLTNTGRLCTESSCSYSGGSVRRGDAWRVQQGNQSGAWLTKPGRVGALPAGASERGSDRHAGKARRGAILGVIGQRGLHGGQLP